MSAPQHSSTILHVVAADDIPLRSFPHESLMLVQWRPVGACLRIAHIRRLGLLLLHPTSSLVVCFDPFVAASVRQLPRHHTPYTVVRDRRLQV